MILTGIFGMFRKMGDRIWKGMENRINFHAFFITISSSEIIQKNNQFAFFAFVKSMKIWIEERKRARAIAMARRMKMPERRSGPEKCRR